MEKYSDKTQNILQIDT